MKNKPEMNPERIFGILDDTLERMEKSHRPQQKRRNPSALPKMKVKRSRHVPELDKIDAGNVVYVPEQMLKSLATSLNHETESLNRLMLQKIMPLLLSFQTSTDYAKAALKEGLSVEIDFDQGLAECVKHVGYLNVVMHFIRRSKLPLSVKKRFVNTFSDKLAELAITTMVEENKAEQRRVAHEHLQAVVYSRQKNKAEVRTRTREEPPVPAPKPTRQKERTKRPQDDESDRSKAPGVRRSRRA